VYNYTNAVLGPRAFAGARLSEELKPDDDDIMMTMLR
jgi:hypothetical protein